MKRNKKVTIYCNIQYIKIHTGFLHSCQMPVSVRVPNYRRISMCQITLHYQIRPKNCTQALLPAYTLNCSKCLLYTDSTRLAYIKHLQAYQLRNFVTVCKVLAYYCVATRSYRLLIYKGVFMYIHLFYAQNYSNITIAMILMSYVLMLITLY